MQRNNKYPALTESLYALGTRLVPVKQRGRRDSLRAMFIYHLKQINQRKTLSDGAVITTRPIGNMESSFSEFHVRSPDEKPGQQVGNTLQKRNTKREMVCNTGLRGLQHGNNTSGRRPFRSLAFPQRRREEWTLRGH